MVENRKHVEKLNGENVMIGLKEKVGREVVRSCHILRHILIARSRYILGRRGTYLMIM